MPNNEEEQAQLIQALQAANERYDSLFQGAGDSIFIVDAETLRIIDANTNASRRLGYSREELLQLTLLDVEVICDSDSENNLAWESTFSGTRVYECELRRKDGSVVPVEVSSRLAWYDQREVLQNFARDITERRQAEDQRRELILEKERIEILTDFISQASHEFRTPLTIIQTSTYVLGKTSDLEQKTRKVHHIETQINSIITLLDSLTLMARLDGGGQDFRFAQVDLNEILRGVCYALQLAFPGGNLNFALELSVEPLFLQGDGEYLRQALRRIVENAVRHSSAGEAITIRSDHRAGKAVAGNHRRRRWHQC